MWKEIEEKTEEQSIVANRARKRWPPSHSRKGNGREKRGKTEKERAPLCMIEHALTLRKASKNCEDVRTGSEHEESAE
jgi:hypothetical protein